MWGRARKLVVLQEQHVTRWIFYANALILSAWSATSLSFVDAKMGDRIHFYADADRWLLVLVSEPSSSEWSPPISLCPLSDRKWLQLGQNFHENADACLWLLQAHP
jgi:hypothetical protein